MLLIVEGNLIQMDILKASYYSGFDSKYQVEWSSSGDLQEN